MVTVDVSGLFGFDPHFENYFDFSKIQFFAERYEAKGKHRGSPAQTGHFLGAFHLGCPAGRPESAEGAEGAESGEGGVPPA